MYRIFILNFGAMAMSREILEREIGEVYRKSPMRLDLCLSAFCLALHSHRRLSVCTPFPTSLFAKKGDKDFVSLEATVQHFPDMHKEFCSSPQRQAVLSTEKGEPPDNPLKNVPLDSLKLLHWLLQLRFDIYPVADPVLQLPREISSRFSWGRQSVGAGAGQVPDYVLKLQESKTRACGPMATFEDVKSRCGSIYAFHGTSAENLHSILRCGLLIVSNSTLQRNGAIFGEGIYLSTDPSVALGFCKPGKNWEHSFFGKRAKYLLACEVAKGEKVLFSDVNSEGSKNGTDLGTYIIVQNCDLVKLRFVFIYTEMLHIGRHKANRELQENGSYTIPRALPKFRRGVWCQIIVLLYIILLLGIAYVKSDGFLI